MAKRNEPEIISRLLKFFEFWRNPNNVLVGKPKNIELFQLEVYRPSRQFVFKWYISKEEFAEVAQYYDVKLTKRQRILCFELGEYNIELAC